MVKLILCLVLTFASIENSCDAQVIPLKQLLDVNSNDKANYILAEYGFKWIKRDTMVGFEQNYYSRGSGIDSIQFIFAYNNRTKIISKRYSVFSNYSYRKIFTALKGKSFEIKVTYQDKPIRVFKQPKKRPQFEILEGPKELTVIYFPVVKLKSDAAKLPR